MIEKGGESMSLEAMKQVTEAEEANRARRVEAQAEAEGIRDVIKAHMGEREELRAGEYKITWKPVTSSRLDAAALRKALPEVAACSTRPSTARRFCVA